MKISQIKTNQKENHRIQNLTRHGTGSAAPFFNVSKYAKANETSFEKIKQTMQVQKKTDPRSFDFSPAFYLTTVGAASLASLASLAALAALARSLRSVQRY